MYARCGVCRNSWPTIAVFPLRSAASRISVACRASRANGFSHITCFPAASAARASGWCAPGGVVIATASRSSRPISSRGSVCTPTMPASFATLAALSRLRLQIAATSQPSERNAGT